MAQPAQKLGFGSGKIRDNGDGTASYFKPFELVPSLQVRIADITGFAIGKGAVPGAGSMFRVLGAGGELASTDVGHVVGGRIEQWLRAHPDFGSNAPVNAPSPAATDGRTVADELVKLAGLRDAGVLTDEEFAAQKAKLLG